MDITQDEQNCILLILVCIEFSFQLLHYYMCITYVCCVSYILGDFRLSVDDLQRMPALHCGKRSVNSVSGTVLSTSPKFVSQSSILPISVLWKMVDETRNGTKLDTVDKTSPMYSVFVHIHTKVMHTVCTHLRTYIGYYTV